MSGFYNSVPGKVVQSSSSLSLLPVWNPGWGNNMKEWGIAIVGKLGGALGVGMKSGTTTLTTPNTTRIVGSGPELVAESVSNFFEKIASPSMLYAGAGDIIAHGTCSLIANPTFPDPAASVP